MSDVIRFRSRAQLADERGRRQCERGYHAWQLVDLGPHAAPGRTPAHWRCARCGMEREGATPGTPPAGRR
ncbi:MAG: hypothetical protein Kow0073_07710 [Immundisolibacter sp.]